MAHPADYLKKPYARLVTPETDGSFRAEILEFPGCIALGDTAAEALASLEDVATDWLELTLSKGQRVPEPTEGVTFSGKFVVRLPKNLHRKAAYAAERDGVSLNQFIVSAVAEQIGATSQRMIATVSPVHHVQFQQNNLLFFGSSSRSGGVLSQSSTSEIRDTTRMFSPWGSSNA